MDTLVRETTTNEVTLENFQRIHSVPLTLIAELDERKISVSALLDLRPGSVLELSRPAGENINLYVENTLLASGEILVVESSLAVRIAELTDKPPNHLTEQQAVADL